MNSRPATFDGGDGNSYGLVAPGGIASAARSVSSTANGARLLQRDTRLALRADDDEHVAAAERRADLPGLVDVRQHVRDRERGLGDHTALGAALELAEEGSGEDVVGVPGDRDGPDEVAGHARPHADRRGRPLIEEVEDLGADRTDVLQLVLADHRQAELEPGRRRTAATRRPPRSPAVGSSSPVAAAGEPPAASIWRRCRARGGTPRCLPAPSSPRSGWPTTGARGWRRRARSAHLPLAADRAA